MTDRRAFLAGMLMAPVAAAAPVQAAATFVCAPVSSSAAWDAAMERYQTAKARNDEFHAFAKPRWDQADAHRPDYIIRHEAKNGSVGVFDLNPHRADYAKYEWDGGPLDAYRFIRPQIERIEAEHEAYQRACDAVGYDQLHDQADEFCNGMVLAEDALLTMPAPHLKALEWKLLRWQEQSADSSLTPENFDQLIADVRRLSAKV